MDLEPIIGLEVHVQLITNTKMFCGCRTDFGAPPNTHVCPVCLGLPGALPVVNRRAVEFAMRAALALNATVHPRSVFARKNYFYPDLPKGYQISQYDQPLSTGGWIDVPSSATRVRLTRIHLEEDAGKSLHHGFADSDRATYLDFNRSGVPLIEIVTEPDLRSPADAAACFAELREVLVALGVNDGNMEEGSLRCDANVSLRPAGTEAFGAKVEVKNINSFKYLQHALEFEVRRQTKQLDAGERVAKETRQWQSDTGETVSMRSKEDAHDYRYFPEPDLGPLLVEQAWVEHVRGALPELPTARRQRLATAYGINAYDADVLVRLPGAVEYFEHMVRAGATAKAASNWIQGELRRKLKDLGRDDVSASAVMPAALAELAVLVEQNVISSSVSKDVFEAMWTSGRSAKAIVDEGGLAQVGDESALAAMADEVIGAHPDVVAQYRGGRTNTLGFLVGQVMKRSGGKANPKLVSDLIKARLANAHE